MSDQSSAGLVPSASAASSTQTQAAGAPLDMVPTPATPPPPLTRRRRWLPRMTVPRLVVLLLVLAGLGAGGYFEVRHLRQQRLFEQAKKEFDRQQYARARGYLNLVLKDSPDNLEARFLVIRANCLLGDFGEAGRQLEASKKLPDPEGRLELAGMLYRAQVDENFAQWERRLTERLGAGDPDQQAILEVLTSQELQFDRLGPAISSANKLLELRPNHLYALYWKGQAFARARDSAEANDVLRQALDEDPDFQLARRALMGNLLDANNPKGAAEQAEILLKADPGDLDTTITLAMAYRKLGDADKAVPLLENVLRLRPHDKGAIVEMALDQYQLDRSSSKTEELLRRACALVPKDREALYAFSRCLRARDSEHDNAAKANAAAAAVGALAYPAWFEQTEQAAIERRLDRLESLYLEHQVVERKIHNNKKGDIPLRLEAARLAEEGGQDQMALKSLRQALSIAPENKKIHKALAGFYERHGDVLMYRYHTRAAEGR